MNLSHSLDRLGTETAFEVLARARALEAQGRTIVHLGIGAPDFDTPQHIKDACAKALADGNTAYCEAQGLPALREACSEYLSRTRGIEVLPQRVVVTPGAKPFLGYAVLATCNPGDEVIYPNPGFPIYESVIRYFGAVPVPLPIARVLEASDAWILSDEVYSEMVYDGAHDSVAAHGLLDRTILVDGFSKTFAMTGWRLGYAAVPEPLVEPLTRLIVNTVSCTPPAIQLAGVAALTGSWDEPRAMIEEFRRRREVVVAGLNALPGITCVMPEGAFYAFPNVTGTGMPAREFASRCLEEAGVAVVAGTSFGEYGEGYLRVSYANSVENIERGLESIGRLLVR